MKEAFSWETFEKVPVVAILRHLPSAQLHPLIHCMQQAGVGTVEVTMNSNDAVSSIRGLSQEFGKTMNVGAGTVCNLEDMHAALEAGAQFIVMPIIQPDVINYCVIHDIPVFPGAFTPSEIHTAWQLGAHMIKVFPASTLGPSYIKDLLAPLNHLKLVPTGGVTKENVKEYMNAGARGVGVGSSLVPTDLLKKEDWKGLENHMKEFVAAIPN
ncbi:bifunctional 4-hydroxy-2-oxoglutarate aldolase/2-dehydro-3-deoxy-phosphogluconate aldolase [Pleomorphovibrio marinus]|uniref:bifunctional 4-hydroxy-2-oxoglutarate aldolase/2-dehydro-3-deoxy-phosphogluconate aldolase n=1 Tax=Pleomorphovibrio marinus TaxID=2164132 RepID=UPI000E0C28B5|nr:bifunctional 4-hydroxy-2-oxoglutarate aldolase/2-dehydro-3-deoxy-phosphogluconate aldolase [Pleomorphovibrio marinus]